MRGEEWRKTVQWYLYLAVATLGLIATAFGDTRGAGPDSGPAPPFGLLLLRESRQLPDGSTVTLRAITSGAEHRIPHDVWTPETGYQDWTRFMAGNRSGTVMFWVHRTDIQRRLHAWVEQAVVLHEVAGPPPALALYTDAWIVDRASHRLQLARKGNLCFSGPGPDDLWEALELSSAIPEEGPICLEVAPHYIRPPRDGDPPATFTLPDMRKARKEMLRAGREYAQSRGWREEDLWLALHEGISDRKPEDEILRRMQPLIDQGVRLDVKEWPRLINDLNTARQLGYSQVATIPAGQLLKLNNG
jgi:hypothetical protein